MKLKFTFIPLLFLSSTIILKAQILDPNKLESKIDSMIPTAINDSTPGLVIGIIKDGNVIFSKGYGMANLSYGIPNSPELVYNIGSVAKQFIGYSYAILHEQGKINIEDPVTEYLDDWPEFDEKVTLKHLLTHSSGYREAYAMSSIAGRQIGIDRLTRDECLEVVRRQPKLEFEPGSRYTYNSTAWVILTEILEKVTEMPAEDWVSQNILEPLEMNNTQIEQFVGDVIYKAAESYTKQENGQFVNPKSNRAIFGAADIYSSINDLAKWIDNFKTLKAGNQDAQKLFLTSHILNDGVDSKYALGIGINNYKGIRQYSHTGGHEAFATQLKYFPDYDIGIVTVSNYGGVGWLNTSEIADFIFVDFVKESDDENQKYQIDEETLKRYAGNYISSDYVQTVKLEIKDGVLNMGNQVLIPISEREFKIKGSNNKISFAPNKNGTYKLSVKSNSTWEYIPYSDWSPTVNQLSEYTGEFYNKEVETTHVINLKNDKLEVANRWIGTESISPLAKDIFTLDGFYYLRFMRDDNDKIIGYDVNAGRTLGVFFEKVNNLDN